MSTDRAEAFADRKNQGYFLKAFGDLNTVFDDDDRDVLTGCAGLDWFIFNDSEDKATDLSAGEFADVLDYILAEV